MERKTRLPARVKALLKQSEVIKRVGRQIYNDAIEARWIEPCAVKTGKKRPRATVYFSPADVIRLEERILAGDYPKLKKT